MTNSEGGIRTSLERALEYRGVWLGAAVLLTVIHFARIYDPGRALMTDTRYFTYFATLVADGAIPHLDFFDNKTQLASLAGGVLVWLGRLFGGDDLVSIRVGYLALTALGGVLVFLLFRRIGRGNSLIALLGVLPYLGFTYIGSLPATGTVPKLIMAIAATGAALAVARRRWLLAGVISAIAPLDWQIGIFACFGVFCAALLDEDARSAAVRTLIGGLAVAVLFVGYFALNGALDPLFSQVIGASVERGEAAGGPFFKFARIERRILWHADHELLLVALGILGMGLLLRWLVLPGLRSLRGPLVVMAVYHYGIVGFSTIDFQGSGDTMLLLHSLAFFAGISLISIFVAIGKLPVAPGTAAALQLAMVALVFVLVRPGIAEPLEQFTPDAPVGVTLEHQLEFVEGLKPFLRGKRLIVLGPSELLFLGGFEHESIFVFWNSAAAWEYQRLRGGPRREPLADFIGEYNPDVIIAKSHFVLPPGVPYEPRDFGQPGGYTVRVLVRTNE